MNAKTDDKQAAASVVMHGGADTRRSYLMREY